ncbi:hypothetical protein VTL71DRAFT_5542 [Oculimacula yallundae]|uniref:Uncharacterized protein n=1 Tax=Oculimacula yallundae TaxID=86028 RepID=A0ABR4C2G9_9HELO
MGCETAICSFSFFVSYNSTSVLASVAYQGWDALLIPGWRSLSLVGEEIDGVLQEFLVSTFIRYLDRKVVLNTPLSLCERAEGKPAYLPST